MYKSLKLILSLNFLSLCNVISGFLLITVIGANFGLGEESDIYFASVTVVVFILSFPQLLWEAIPPFFSSSKKKNTNEHIGLYFVILLLLVIISILIAAFTYSLSNSIQSNERHLSITIASLVYFVLRSIINYNNVILNLIQKYRAVQLLEILVNFTSIIFVFYLPSKVYFALNLFIYQSAISALVVCVQTSMIWNTRNNDSIRLPQLSQVKSLLRISILLKLGSLIYNLKDLIILNIFGSSAEGSYSIYNISLKLASALNKVASTPIQSLFITKINNMKPTSGGNFPVQETKQLALQTVVFTSLLFFAGAFTQYLILDVLTKIFNISNGEFFFEMFILNTVYYFVIVLFYPFYHTLVAVNYTSPLLLLNIIFLIFTAGSSLIFSNIQHVLLVIITLQVLLGISMFYLSFSKLKRVN